MVSGVGGRSSRRVEMDADSRAGIRIQQFNGQADKFVDFVERFKAYVCIKSPSVWLHMEERPPRPQVMPLDRALYEVEVRRLQERYGQFKSGSLEAEMQLEEQQPVERSSTGTEVKPPVAAGQQIKPSSSAGERKRSENLAGGAASQLERERQESAFFQAEQLIKEQQERLRVWEEHNRQLQAWLVLFTTNVPLGIVKAHRGDGLAAWEALQAKYLPRTTSRCAVLHHKLTTMAPRGGEDPDEYFIQLEEVRERLSEMGEEVSWNAMRSYVIMNLPTYYSPIMATLKDKLTYDDVKEAVRWWYDFKSGKKASSASSSGSENDAMYAGSNKIGCFVCGQTGHYRNKCPNRNSGGAGADGGGGGSAGGGGGGNGGSTGWRGGGATGSSGGAAGSGGGTAGGGGGSAGGSGGSKKNRAWCNKCKTRGHLTRDCDGRKNRNVTANVTEDLAVVLATMEGDVALMAAVEADGSRALVVDSGSTAHMTGDAGSLTDIEQAEGVVRLGDKRTLRVTGVGRLRGATTDAQGRRCAVTLEDVLLVPGLGPNLLSVERMCEKGARVVFDQGGASIDVRGAKLRLERVGRLHVLRLTQGETDTGSAGEMVNSARAEDGTTVNTAGVEDGETADEMENTGELQHYAFLTEFERWHRRVGHRGENVIRQLIKMDVGVPESVLTALRPSVECDACAVSKSTLISFPSSVSHRSTDLFGLVCTDVLGPIEEALDGSTFAIIFKDEASRWMRVYLMRSKDEAVEKLALYLKDIQCLVAGARVASMRSDRGGEYIQAEFQDMLRDNGIRWQPAGPYAPEQNGLAERSWRTSVEMARCLRTTAGLGIEFWGEALKTAIYLLNREPTAGLNGNTPHQVIFGHHAHLGHLRVFGCQAYVHKLKINRRKFDDTAWRGILVGYDDSNRRAYRVYDPETGRIKSVIHVRFNEQRMPARLGSMLAREQEEGFDEQPASSTVGASSAVGAPAAAENGGRAAEQETIHAAPAGDGQDDEEASQATSKQASEASQASGKQASGASSAGGGAGAAGDGAAGAGSRRPSRDLSKITRYCTDPQCRTRGVHLAHAAEAKRVTFADSIEEFACAVAGEILEGQDDEPQSFREAMEGPEGEQWQAAYREERQAMDDHDVYELCVLPEGKKALKTMVVFKKKRDAQGRVVRHKCRIVINGKDQPLHSLETFAPTAQATSIRVVTSLAATQGWELHTMDVNTAFLQSPIDTEVYARQPPGEKKLGPDGRELVWRLKKSLYGLRQAPRNWNRTISDWLVESGFTISSADACVFTRRKNGETLVVVLYVDDLLIASSTVEAMVNFKRAISIKFNMKDLGETRYILGMEVIRNRAERTLELRQTGYVQRVLERFGMEQARPVATPAEGSLARSESGGKPELRGEFLQMVGAELHATRWTRPDGSFAVHELSRHMSAVEQEHVVAAKRVLRYLRGTSELGIKYGGMTGSDAGTKLVGYCDSDWAGDVSTRRSTTGYVFMLGGAAVSWESRLQPTVALSSSEAEYMALSAAVQEALHLRQLLKDLGFEQRGATPIKEDNQACIALSKNKVTSKRTKHIDVRYHFTRERVESGEVVLEYVPSAEQLADLLTKALERVKVERLRARVLGHDDI